MTVKRSGLADQHELEDILPHVHKQLIAKLASSFWPDNPYGSQQFLEGFTLHRGDVAILVKENFVPAKLTGDNPPAAAGYEASFSRVFPRRVPAFR